MHTSPNPLPESARREIAAALGDVLVDGIDLHSQIKVAHWNVKGPHFAALHPLFESFAVALAGHNDAVAERAVTLGALVRGSARHVAASSRLPDYPDGVTRGLEHVRLLADRIEAYLRGVRQARAVAEKHADQDTFDLLTEIVTTHEKNAWFLRASLED
ncbi:MAG: DNA starvation/stationary phase protection protein Dps [Myxococcota bacterium]|nr:DNA starvation/stationary phase protection protein Dps [Myxococcota bacterium]MDW8363745.1 DNA starvation/stationary phase protection protein Dps [Myxococcales bacterium]